MITVGERSKSQSEFFTQMLESAGSDIRVAMPGIITAFDAVEQTVTVQPALRERLTGPDGSQKWVQLPLLLDVPICIPRAGGFAITLPIKKGDECLVVFADQCIDAWWSNGGVQNQIELRRHDLSDAFAIVGTYSQPKRITNYSTASMQLRNDSGSQMINISQDDINLIGNVKVNGVTI
jgi:hypothetical protein